MEKYFVKLKNLLSVDDSLKVSLYSSDEIKVLSDSIICESSLRAIVSFAVRHRFSFYLTTRLYAHSVRPCIFIRKAK